MIMSRIREIATEQIFAQGTGGTYNEFHHVNSQILACE